jgi:hypothetical protein
MAYTFWEDKNNIILSDNVDFDGEVFLMNFTVKTKRCSGWNTFFIHIKTVEKYVNILEAMYRDLDGGIEITDNESSSKIQLKKEDNEWCVSGQYCCPLNRNVQMFYFNVDHTVIQILSTFFKNILAHYGVCPTDIIG